MNICMQGFQYRLVRLRQTLGEGLLPLLRLLAASLFRAARQLSPSAWRGRAAARQRELDFDRKLGVDTSGIVRPDKGEVRGDNWKHGVRYQAVNPEPFLEVLQRLPANLEQFTFIDFGSGKGRALLLAAQFPFKKIIGIEYSESLHRVAQQNLSGQSTARVCPDVESICMDAAQFGVPSGPLVLFLFNPFGREVMRRVVANVAASFREDPRRILVIYFNPEHADLWETTGFLSPVRPSPWMSAVFDSAASIPNKAVGKAGTSL